MDTEETIISESTDDPPWDPWSPWSLWNLDIFGIFWVRYRKRDRITTTVVSIRSYRVVWKCPGGTLRSPQGCEGIGGPAVLVDPVPYREPIGPATIDKREDKWTEIEWHSIPIFHGTIKATRGERSNAFRIRRTDRAKINKSIAKQLNGTTWPAMCEGNRLTLSQGPIDYSMTLDGTPHSPRRALIASKLGIGFHVIELTPGAPGEDSKIRRQIPLSVISPIEVKMPPIAKIQLKGKINGGIITVRLHNRSRSEHAIRLEPDSVPSGWMALRLGKPVLVLKPDRSAKVKIKVDRMIVAEVTSEPLQFSIRVSFPGTEISDAHTTFYVIARELHSRKRQKLISPSKKTL